MQKRYHHFTLAEREIIAEMLWEEKTASQIATVLNRNKSTISRELHRNASPKYQCYMPHRAQERAEMRKQHANQRTRLKNDRIRDYVITKLKEDWSPEIIAGRIQIDRPDLSISHEAIYQYIYHPQTPNRLELIKHLRRSHRRRKKKDMGRKERKTKIPNRIPIDARPSSVETRSEFGHWEGDTLVSRKSAYVLNSLVERKSRLLQLTRLKRRGAAETKEAVVKRLTPFPQNIRRSLTLDNGTEHVLHEEITKAIGLPCFFCHPYSAWERGSNENINGLIRWYLPKGTDFANISDEMVGWIESRLNHRPRKCLDFKTPLEDADSYVALRG
jgi:IS30 family transposase